jgi:HSP20 family protein
MYTAYARVYGKRGDGARIAGQRWHRKEGRKMSMMRWDPFRWDLFDDLGGLRRSMDRVFDELLMRSPRRATTLREWEPAVEMFETANEVVVRTELPNIDPKNVEITVTEDIITLRGETKHEEEQKERNYHYRELVYGTFTRTLRLPAAVKGAEAKAVYKDGVLEVKIPKAAHVKPIPVKVQTAA